MSQKYVILEGKDLDTLIENGLRTLNKNREQVEIEVLEKGKTLMGISIKEYKIKMSPKLSEVEEIEKKLESILDETDNQDSFELSFQEDGVYITIINEKNTYTNVEQMLNRIRNKRIKDIDVKAIEKALNSTEKEKIKIAPEQEEVLIDAKILIDISRDGLSAFVTLIPPDGGKDLTMDIVLGKLNEEIKYGLEIHEVEKIIKERVYNKRTLIARGKPPIHGKDGYIKYFFSEKKDKVPHILEDGSADFRNLDLIDNVRAGDILAELIPPTNGRQGITVRGETISYQKGKEAVLRYGKNIKTSEDGYKLIAEKDGQVRLEDNKVLVHEVFEVKGNVDNSTGNIKFNGAVKINGSVLTGFEVITDGDIEIEGVVEGAEINSQGNILLRRGIQGYNKGRLISKGSIVAKYIENSYIDADGDITSEAIMHSEIISRGSIKVSGKKGLIVGGVCRATQEIMAKTIGSSMATATVLEVGVDPSQRNNQEVIRNEIDEVGKNLEKLDKTITLLNRLSKIEGLTAEKEDMLRKTILTRSSIVEKLNSLKKELSSLDLQIELLSKGKIKVENIIYPGVKIIMGNSSMYIRDEIKHCTIYKENNELKIGPYEL